MSPEEDYEDRARRRAGLVLGALALAAIVVVALVFTLGRHTGNSHAKPNLAVATTSAPRATSSAPKPTVSRTTAKATVKPTASSTPSSQVSCANTPCVLSGDAGKVVAAVGSFRTGKGVAAVTGAATPAAGACALHSGNAPYCPGSYYWVHVPALQGAAVVAKIQSLGGSSWLLNPAMKKISFGCAQAGAGDYSCAVFNVG